MVLLSIRMWKRLWQNMCFYISWPVAWMKNMWSNKSMAWTCGNFGLIGVQHFFITFQKTLLFGRHSHSGFQSMYIRNWILNWRDKDGGWEDFCYSDLSRTILPADFAVFFILSHFVESRTTDAETTDKQWNMSYINKQAKVILTRVLQSNHYLGLIMRIFRMLYCTLVPLPDFTYLWI